MGARLINFKINPKILRLYLKMTTDITERIVLPSMGYLQSMEIFK